MATYVVADIHGQYELFVDLLEQINIQDSDELYVIGDTIDRGKNPIKVLQKLMEMPNVICLAGNHELQALECLDFLRKEITESSIEELDEKMLDNILTWQQNGSKSTIEEFRVLSPQEQQEVIDFIEEFSLYEEITVEDKQYLLVHAGLGNYAKEKDIEDYSVKELLWDRADYDVEYFDDIYTVTGHIPTQTIENNPRPGYIYRANHHIAIDCGAYIPGGRLAAICLETGEEFYAENTEE